MGAGKETPRRVTTFVNLKMFDLVTRVSKAQGSALLVMYSLARHFNNDEGCSRPSTALIAAETHMTIRYAHAMVKRLEAIGEVSVYRQKDQVNRYYIHLKDTPDGKIEFARRVMKSAMEDSGKYRVAVSHAPRASHVNTSSRGTRTPLHATTGTPLHAAREDLFTLIINEQSEEQTKNIQWPPATLEASPSGSLEGVGLTNKLLEQLEGIRGLRGNRARGKNKRYSCKLTLAELTRLTSSLLTERPADLVLAALGSFHWGDGFTSGRAFVQKLALRKWVLGQKPPLLDETIALLERVDADAVLADLGLDRFIPFARHRDDFRRYITSDDLFRLHDALKLAV